MKSTFPFGIIRLWWIPLITGILSIALGIWTFLCPAESLPTLAIVFAACIGAAGLLNLAYVMSSSMRGANWGWGLAIGLLEIVASVWLFCLPTPVLTAAFIYIVGAWILVVAIVSLCEAGTLGGHSEAGQIIWMILLLAGTFLFAFLFLSNPISGATAVWLWLGLSLITFGGYRIALAFKVHRLNKALGR